MCANWQENFSGRNSFQPGSPEVAVPVCNGPFHADRACNPLPIFVPYCFKIMSHETPVNPNVCHGAGHLLFPATVRPNTTGNQSNISRPKALANAAAAIQFGFTATPNGAGKCASLHLQRTDRQYRKLAEHGPAAARFGPACHSTPGSGCDGNGIRLSQKNWFIGYCCGLPGPEAGNNFYAMAEQVPTKSCSVN